MQLSKHFKLEEFTKSMTATRKGIKNEPGSGDIKNLENICYEILEPVRAKFDKPVTITSGYRSEELCEAIGSKKTSQHAKGQAVDFEIAGIPNILLMMVQRVGSIVVTMKKVQIENRCLLMMEKNLTMVFLK
jgi:uncharacterized protein YcbK (DUF882 family)